MLKTSLDLLNERGVEINDIVDCVIFLQKDYVKDIESIDIESVVNGVISKREVQHAILTGINIDKTVENKVFSDSDSDEGLSKISDAIMNDEGLYGIDEVLAYGICNLYGSITYTNFGYIDRVKPGIIGELDNGRPGECHTFLDDIIGAIAAAAASKLAHSKR